MANKKIFGSQKTSVKVPVANTVNKAGGKAYDLGAKGGLAQYVVTGCFNQTFYASAEEQVDAILKLANSCESEFIAKAAVYAHRVARMKDTPALLANVLANRGEEGITYLRAIFPQVISGTKMLRNFCQVLRSGKVGRKSFGTAIKNMIQNWLNSQDAEALFKGSVGNDPSLADVVRMVHPKPKVKAQEAFYAWLLGKEYQKRYLPKLIKEFEKFKAGESTEVPEVDFRMLTALNLGTEQWSAIARNASWNTVRMNLNTFQRHGCFTDTKLVSQLAEKLRDEKEIQRANAFPYQLLTAYLATKGQIPMELSLALQDALEIATRNIPEINGGVAVCVDTSGSMSSPVTGTREGATTKTTCVQVASLIAASMLRVNKNATIVPFDTSVHPATLNPRDSIMTNAEALAKFGGGGTDCASAIRHLNAQAWRGNLILFVSDNESWYSPGSRLSGIYFGGRRGTDMATEWTIFKQKNPKAKLVCLDIQPGRTAQVPDDKDVLNIGGFTDSVFEVISNFVNNDSRDFATVIEDAIEFSS